MCVCFCEGQVMGVEKLKEKSMLLLCKYEQCPKAIFELKVSHTHKLYEFVCVSDNSEFLLL